MMLGLNLRMPRQCPVPKLSMLKYSLVGSVRYVLA